MKTCDCKTLEFIEYKLQNGNYIHMPTNPMRHQPHTFNPMTGVKTTLTMAEAFKMR